MSGTEGEGQLNAHMERSEQRRKRPKGYRSVVIVMAALAVVIVIISAGVLDPVPKRQILKANEMSKITGLTGQWEQTTFHCFEGEASPPHSSLRAAHSIMYFFNETSDLSIAITVAEMGSSSAANEEFDHWVDADSASGFNNTAIDVGEEGYINGHGSPGINPYSTCWVLFHKGVFYVEMHFDGVPAELELIEEVASEQASRL